MFQKKKKLNYAIVGEEAGASKLEKLAALGTPQLDEDGLLKLIRESWPEGSKEREAQPEVGTMKEQTLVIGANSGASGSSSDVRPLKSPAAVKMEAAPGPVAAPKAARDTSADLWTEKYKPVHVDDLVGNFSNAQKVVNWIEKWTPKRGSGHRAVLFSGPPGIGKTSMAHVILSSTGWEVMEFNARWASVSHDIYMCMATPPCKICTVYTRRILQGVACAPATCAPKKPSRCKSSRSLSRDPWGSFSLRRTLASRK
jgi:hypothetical protein